MGERALDQITVLAELRDKTQNVQYTVRKLRDQRVPVAAWRVTRKCRPWVVEEKQLEIAYGDVVLPQHRSRKRRCEINHRNLSLGLHFQPSPCLRSCFVQNVADSGLRQQCLRLYSTTVLSPATRHPLNEHGRTSSNLRTTKSTRPAHNSRCGRQYRNGVKRNKTQQRSGDFNLQSESLFSPTGGGGFSEIGPAVVRHSRLWKRY